MDESNTPIPAPSVCPDHQLVSSGIITFGNHFENESAFISGDPSRALELLVLGMTFVGGGDAARDNIRQGVLMG
jgi:hypothetical protein